MPPPVSDPALLAQLNTPKPVTDPAVLEQLNKPAAPEPRPQGAPAGSFKEGAGEAAAEFVTAGMSAIPAGWAGIGAQVGNLFGADNDVGGLVRRVQDYLTYHPQTEMGQRVSDTANYPLQKYSEATNKLGDTVAEKSGSPGLGAAVKTAADVLPGSLLEEATGPVSRAAGRRVTDLAAERSRNTVRDESIEHAHRVGYSLPPSEAGGGVGQAIESVASKPKIEKMIAERNQEVTNRLTRTAIGLPPDTPLSLENVERVRNDAGRIYERLRNTGDVPWDQDYIDALANVGDRFAKIDRAFPNEPGQPAVSVDRSQIERLKGKYFQQQFTAGEAIDAIRELRADARNSFAKQDPVIGSVQREIAQVLETRLERHVESLGQPELVQQFRDARQLIARTIAVEDALNTSTGNVNATHLGRQADRGVPLDGDLALVARMANAFPKALQSVESKGKEGNFTAVEFLAAAAGLHAAALARPAARSFVASGAGSRMLTGPGNYEPSMATRAGVAAGGAGRPAAIATPAELAAQDQP
jgi:hypothetical protein